MRETRTYGSARGGGWQQPSQTWAISGRQPSSRHTDYRCTFPWSATSGNREGLVTISKSRKSKAETLPPVSKARQTRRLPANAVLLHGRSFNVKATQFPRRQFLHLAADAAALPAVSRVARAQAYPARPVRIILGFPPGGATDILARLIGQWLSERLGQPFVIENRPGAGGNIGAEAVVRAPADGYTLLVVATPNAINATLYEKLNFNFIRDIAPVASLIDSPLVMEVHPSHPAKTVPEFIAYAKANPGKLNMASAGVGTSIHVAGELFKMMTGVHMVHVPYRGAPAALTDLIGGQVQVMFDSLPSSVEYIRSGRLRPLAVTTTTRSGTLPDVPTVGEFVPGYEARAWWGVGAPQNTPAEIIERLNREINAALADPVMKARFVDLGTTVFPGSAADFKKFIADETEKWAKVVKFSGAKVE
jgi:tripartite-type tricarboxylate transporter receptor subunit TctC